MGAAGAFGTKPPGKRGERREVGAPAAMGCGGGVYTHPHSPKSHRGSSTSSSISRWGIWGSRRFALFGARRKRAFIPAQPHSQVWGWAARVWGGPHLGHTHTHEHPRQDLAPKGPEGRGGRRGFPSALRGGGFRFSRWPPRWGTGGGFGSARRRPENPGEKTDKLRPERQKKGAAGAGRGGTAHPEQNRAAEEGAPLPEASRGPQPGAGTVPGLGWGEFFLVGGGFGNLRFSFPSLEAERCFVLVLFGFFFSPQEMPF